MSRILKERYSVLEVASLCLLGVGAACAFMLLVELWFRWHGGASAF